MSASVRTALEMDDLPTRPGPVVWGEGPPPGATGWHLRLVREASNGRLHLSRWYMSKVTARWLLAELDRRLAALRGVKLVGGPDPELSSCRRALGQFRPVLEGFLEETREAV